MNPVENLYGKISGLPGIEAQKSLTTVTALVEGRDGFDVSLVSYNNRRFTVFYRGWHRSFDDAGEAENCFMRGLSNRVRLKVTRRGRFEHKWIVERRTSSGWAEIGRNALKLVPYWRGAKTLYLENNIVDPDASRR